MSKPSKKKFEKKKKHELETYKKLLARKADIRTKAKKEKADWRLEKATKEKIEPFKKPIKTRTAEDIAKQIEANLQKLKDMEKEYEQAVIEREGFNEALEAEGFKSIKDKMDFLNEKAKEQTKWTHDSQRNG